MSDETLTAEEYRIAAKVCRAEGCRGTANFLAAKAAAMTPTPDEPTREEIEARINLCDVLAVRGTTHSMYRIEAATLRRVWRDKLEGR